MTAADSAIPETAPGAVRIAVIGGGIAGIIAALECAKVGLDVTLIEREDELGGTIRTGDVGGFALDLGPDGWATAGGHVRTLVDDLGLGERVSAVSAEPAWVAGLPSGSAPLPTEAVLGIPANTWDPAVRRIVGWSGVWRAYLDRLRPPLTIGQEHSLDKLVRGRMGDLVADRLVAPITVGRYGISPADIDVDAAAPRLNTALTRTGSLGGAVSQLLGERGAGYETLEGGAAQLIPALRARLSDFAVSLVTGATARRLEPREGGWTVHADGLETPLDVHAVIVATEEAAARRLLAPVVEGVAAVDATRLQDVVTVVVDSPDLDTHPRGAIVYPLPGSSDIASVAHVTARWPWLESLGPHRHVLRVSFPQRGAGSAEPADLLAKAVSAASTLLGVPLPPDAVLGARHAVFSPAPPAAARGRRAAAAAVRAAVHAVDGLAVVGGWLSGNGLAQVIPDARTEADRLRRRALWGSAAVEE